MHLEDMPHVGAFNYRLRGFSNYTCHHYFKHYQLRLLELASPFQLLKNNLNSHCIGARKKHKVLLDLMTDFKKQYNNLTNNLIIMHYVENSHDSNDRLNWIDNDLYEFLSNGYNNKLFDNTAIFLYSDHGSRFVDKRSSHNRYLEERLPFFSIYLPEKYKLNNPIKYNNLKMNTKLLTSPFDIYSTVRDLTCLDSKKTSKNENSFSRSISLLNEISPRRNCEHIGISEHYCTCVQDWAKQKVDHPKIVEAAKFSVNSINELIYKVRNLCATLQLSKVIYAETLNKKNHKVIKIQFITLPNKGVYEAVIIDKYMKKYEFKSTYFSIKSRNDISRIDAYGEQPRCISNFDRNPADILDLRKFCFCIKRFKIVKL